MRRRREVSIRENTVDRFVGRFARLLTLAANEPRALNFNRLDGR